MKDGTIEREFDIPPASWIQGIIGGALIAIMVSIVLWSAGKALWQMFFN